MKRLDWFSMLITTWCCISLCGCVTKELTQNQIPASLVQSQAPVRVIYDELSKAGSPTPVGQVVLQIINRGNVNLTFSASGRSKVMRPGESVKYLVTNNTSVTVVAGAYDAMGKMLPGSIAYSGFIQPDGPTTMTFSGDNGKWYITENTIRGMISKWSSTEKTTGGMLSNIKSQGDAKFLDLCLQTNEAKSVSVGNKNVLELAVFDNDESSCTVFIAKPTKEREQLHEIARYYMKRFSIDPDQEGDKRGRSLEIFFYSTADAFPREQFCKLLQAGASGKFSRFLSSDAMRLAEGKCSAKYFMPFFGKGRVTNIRWRRLNMTYGQSKLKGNLIGLGLNQAETHLLIALSDGRVLIDLAKQKQLIEKGSVIGGDSFDKSDPSTGWYQASTKTAYGFGDCKGQKFNIIGPGSPISEELLQVTKIEDMLINPDDFMLGTKNKDVLIIGHINPTKKHTEHFELLVRRNDIP